MFRKAIAPGGAAGLQTRLGTASVPGPVRLRLPSASFQTTNLMFVAIPRSDSVGAKLAREDGLTADLALADVLIPLERGLPAKAA
jgi:hypothetical protein